MRSTSPSPRGPLLFALIALAASAGFVRLGFWQVERFDEVRAENRLIAGRVALAPLTLTEAMSSDPDSLYWRRVQLAGTPLGREAVVIRTRALRGQPGIHVVVPYRLPEARGHVLVLEGWLPSADGVRATLSTGAPDPGANGEVPLALIRESRAGLGEPMIELGEGSRPVRSFAAVDVEAIGAELPGLAPFFLQRLPSDADSAQDAPVRLTGPEPDGGPHLGYAIQWFSFALVTIVGTAAFLRRGRRRPEDQR